jgi:hypothetical protein
MAFNSQYLVIEKQERNMFIRLQIIKLFWEICAVSYPLLKYSVDRNT